ncbi:Eukaryotic translation initiation factor 1A [Mycena chlorophos]|uniref:Eukaryotic translation initiation factor 4C n=1 Tax=Mycena chlorophos TaxID=658473 RepID=A0A8H6THN4_MYCCL|nr:Eukaryotic translation initiation factor 1A [Mycena chlorophos]
MSEYRLRSIALYKELHRLGRDHNPGYNFHHKLRSLYERNRSLEDPKEVEDAFRLLEYIKQETLALYSLRKYRHLRRVYPGPACRRIKERVEKIVAGGKNENDDDKRELVFREDGQEYAQVVKMLGNGRLEAQCFDGEKRLAHIRGKMRKKVWINQGDIVLLSLRDFQDDKADVIVKYTADEARNLKAYGELPENAKINETDTFGEEDGECTFEFGDEGDLDIDDI